YKFVTRHVIGELSFDEMRSQLETAIHQFAKRQMTWFRGMERRGFRICWLPYDMPRQEFTERVVELVNAEEGRQ
ncbi:MAG: tRNA (adenosine(37)-N6)-dimethylallyltransferase MiaA, partial [Muribaculaceae bacterium]|nr:tRNA (adenosine(37)-N6)-dimethylallyltransferase MiaA [Muribaculaceae bacterium]